MPSALAEGRAEVRVSGSRGRHLVATQRLRAGDIVLVAEPYAAVLDDGARHLRCDHTFATAADAGVGSLLRCARSKVARYASREAQAAAWREGYKEECAALVKCAPRVPPPTVRLAARVLWRRRRERARRETAYAEAAAESVGLGEGYDSVRALVHHWDKVAEEDRARFAHAAAAASAFLNARLAGDGISGGDAVRVPPYEPEPEPESDLIDFDDRDPEETPLAVAKLIARLSFNCHALCDDESRPYGVGVYPPAATMNHACFPNCAQSFRGKTLFVRCLRDVRPEEELTIAYVELAVTRAERRAELMKQYAFDIDENSAENEKSTFYRKGVPSASGEYVAPPTETSVGSSVTLHDHGAFPDSAPPWRMDERDVTHACVATVRGANAGGVVVVGPARVGKTGAADAERDEGERRVEVHVWGPLAVNGFVANREHVAAVAAELARVVADAERLADEDEAPIADGSADRSARDLCLERLARFKRLVDGSDETTNFALGPGHALRHRAHAVALRTQIRCGDFVAARKTAVKFLLPAYRRAYPFGHPPLAQHLALLAKIETFLGGAFLPAAAKHGAEAAAMLRVCQGHSPMFKEVEQRTREAEHELSVSKMGAALEDPDAENAEVSSGEED